MISFSVLFWLNKSRSKNNKPAIYLRLSVGGKRAELSTYQYVTPALWNAATQSVKGNSEEAQAINRELITLKAQYHVSDKPLSEIHFSFAPDFEHFLTTAQGIGKQIF